jgi:hypothetical protein
MHYMMFLSRSTLVLLFVSNVLSENQRQRSRRLFHKKVTMSVDKGMTCQGGMSDKGAGKACRGGISAEFSMECTPEEFVSEVAHGLEEQVRSIAIMNADDLMLDMNQVMDADDEMLMTEGAEKTFEFGGYAKVEWGCNVTYAMTKGKLSKTSRCGFRSEEGKGMKPTEDDSDIMLQE